MKADSDESASTKTLSFELISGPLVPPEIPKVDGKQIIQGNIPDITERKQAEEALRASEERYRTLFDLGPVAVYSCDASGVIQQFNRRAAELWGREPEAGDTDERFCGSFKMFRPDGSFMPHEQCPMAEVVAGKIPAVHDAEVLIERPDGSRVTVVVNIRPLITEGGEITGAINCFYDITQRKQAERAAASLATIVESSNDAIISKDLNGIITSWNGGAERIFGYRAEEMIGQSIMRIIPPDRQEEETQILMRLQRGERVDHFDTVRVRRDNRPIDVSVTISPIKDSNGTVIGAAKIARDITEHKRIEQERDELSRELEKQVLKRTAELLEANRALLKDMEERQKLEEQFHQAQKLESVGVLAAGVAHDLNNLLNIIQGYASVIGPDVPRDEIGESVDAITETTKRGAALVQQLLTLARKTEIKKESVDINTLIERLSNFIKETFPKNIETTLDLSPILPSIVADANQINQVLLNLCVNARDAMSAGGKVLLKTSVVQEGGLEVYGALEAQPYVSIEITDTGTGMDEYIQSKIFEPFFTTKEIGKGTGLGLAVVYGIVKSHNGFVDVTSQPMRGTTFRLYFPTIGG